MPQQRACRRDSIGRKRSKAASEARAPARLVVSAPTSLAGRELQHDPLAIDRRGILSCERVKLSQCQID
jgi:hypothetical protein